MTGSGLRWAVTLGEAADWALGDLRHFSVCLTLLSLGNNLLPSSL